MLYETGANARKVHSLLPRFRVFGALVCFFRYAPAPGSPKVVVKVRLDKAGNRHTQWAEEENKREILISEERIEKQPAKSSLGSICRVQLIAKFGGNRDSGKNAEENAKQMSYGDDHNGGDGRGYGTTASGSERHEEEERRGTKGARDSKSRRRGSAGC